MTNMPSLRVRRRSFAISAFVQLCTVVGIVVGIVIMGEAPSSSAYAAKPVPVSQPIPLATSLPAAAKTQWEAGRVMYTNAKDAHDYRTALDNFLVAYDLSKDARVFWYIAACEKELGDRPAASEAVHRYLAEGKQQSADRQLTEKEQQQGQELIDLLAPYVTTIAVTTSEDGVALAVDDKSIGTSPLSKPVYIEVGHRVLHATKGGMRPVDQPFEAISSAAETPIPLTVTMTADTGRLLIDVNANATIELDEKVIGAGHVDATVSTGPHRLHMSANGKVARSENLQVASGSTQTLSFTLQDTPSGVPTWVWIAGGVVVAGGLTLVGIEIFKPGDRQTSVPPGSLGETTASSFRFR